MHPKLDRPPAEYNLQLKDTFTPLCTEAAKAMDDGISPELRAEIAAQPMYALENPVFDNRHEMGAELNTPWDLLKGVDIPERPSDIRDIQARVNLLGSIQDTYFAAHPELPSETQDDREDVLMFAESLIFSKQFDIDRWRRNEYQLDSLSEEERNIVLDCRKNQAHNGVKGMALYETDLLPSTEKVLFAHNPLIPEHYVVGNLAVPVGAYGEEFAKKLISYTMAMQALAQRELTGLATEVTEGNEEFLHTYTARGNEEPEATPETTMLTLQEGILSVMQSIAILTAEKVEGYETGEELLQAITDAGLVERLTRYAPMGLVGPMALLGKYMPEAIKKVGETVAFSDDFEAFLKKCKANFIADFIAQNEIELSEDEVGNDTIESSRLKTLKALGRVCPLSGKGGGIDQITDALTSSIIGAQEY